MRFGIMIGQEPWWQSTHNYGFVSNAGSVFNNMAWRAAINLATDGIASRSIGTNTLSDPDPFYTAAGWCAASSNYTAHFFGNASMPPSYDKKWFFARTDKICGSWAGGPPEHDRQPGDQPGTLVHKGDSPAPQFDYPLPQYLGPDGELWSRNHFYYLSVPGRYGRPGDLQGGRHSL